MRLSHSNRSRGQAMVAVVVVSALVLALGSAMIGLASVNTERARSGRLEESLAYGARSGVTQAKFLFWERYMSWLAAGNLPVGWPAQGDLGLARQYLSNELSGVITAAEDLDNGETLEVLRMVLGPGTVDSTEVRGERVWVVVTARRDDPNNRETFVTIRSTATSWDPATGNRAARIAAGLPADQRVNETVFRFGGPIFNGFDFALLANAINCTFCHAEIDNSHRMYNTDPTKYGTFDRVKVACLESLEMRGDPRSRIAGTLYVNGTVVDASGNPLAPNGAGPWGGSGTGASGLKSAGFDASGKILESGASTNPESRLTVTNFVDSPKDGSGNYNAPLGNFYKDYPTDPAQQIDGPVPEKFPVVVKDSNFDRQIDDGEWSNHVAAGNGFDGTITGGVARVVLPKDGSVPYTHTRLPIGNGASGVPENAVLPAGGTTNQNVILVGTRANPIVINGKVAIDGDAVISGYVKGTGQLLVRGNLYIEGDLAYADGTDGSGNRTFGVASDGTQNAVAYAAGGSILHGSYLWGDGRANGNQGDLAVTGQGDEAPANARVGMPVQQAGWWNRTEWGRSMPNFNNGLKQPTTGSTGTPNVGYIANYVPRFYTFQQNGTVWLYGPNNLHNDWTGAKTRWANDAASGGFWVGDGRDDGYQTNASKKLTQMGADVPASYITMSWDPKNNWISQSTLRQMQRNAESDRENSTALGPWAGEAAGERKYKLDGLFYTSNAIMFMARVRGINDSGNGQIEFNGSVVAADTGILSPNGLWLNYDYRVKNLLTVEDEEVDIFVVAEREGVN